jgi:hypothetical protein
MKGLKGSKARVFGEKEATTVKTVQRNIYVVKKKKVLDGEEENCSVATIKFGGRTLCFFF